MIKDCVINFIAASVAAIIGLLIATNGRIEAQFVSPACTAWMANLLAIIPSAIVRNLVLHDGIRHLASIAWRFPSALATSLLSSQFEGPQRNCFLITLLTCYFITLTLESWLQIRQVQTQQASKPS